MSSPLRPMPLGWRDDMSPVFIVGAGRSGTTLVRLILNAHPDLAVIGETAAFHRVLKYGDLSRPWYLDRFRADWRDRMTTQSPYPDLVDDPAVVAEMEAAEAKATRSAQARQCRHW